uniref:Charged multivesicular body protein 1B n=1 Tax=Gopherus evgoodei TaxID=1825980 RepID=A0A8C4YHA0_9SAUR
MFVRLHLGKEALGQTTFACSFTSLPVAGAQHSQSFVLCCSHENLAFRLQPGKGSSWDVLRAGLLLFKQAIQKGNTEVARIHAENAIRQKNQAINFLRMSARVDAVAARVQTAVTMGKVTKSMAGVVKSMDATLKIFVCLQISALMDKFEHQFETLDVQTAQMEDTMSNTTTLTTPQNQVDTLLQEMADEAGLDLNMELPQGQTGSVGTVLLQQEQVNTAL